MFLYSIKSKILSNQKIWTSSQKHIRQLADHYCTVIAAWSQVVFLVKVRHVHLVYCSTMAAKFLHDFAGISVPYVHALVRWAASYVQSVVWPCTFHQGFLVPLKVSGQLLRESLSRGCWRADVPDFHGLVEWVRHQVTPISRHLKWGYVVLVSFNDLLDSLLCYVKDLDLVIDPSDVKFVAV